MMNNGSRQQISAGTASIRITPPIGHCLSGSFSESRATDVLDELFMNAVALLVGGQPILFLSADIVFIPNEVYQQIVRQIEQRTGIAKEHVILSATHTHRGTMLEDSIGVWKHDPQYNADFIEAAVAAAVQALNPVQEVRIGVGKRDNSNHVFNRRYKKPDGSIVMSWAYDPELHADCITEGPVDPEVTVLKIEDMQGKPIALIVNYATHNNAHAGPMFSAGISGAMTETLKKVYGEHLVVLFVQGASGDISCIDHRLADRSLPTKYIEIGRDLADTVQQIDAVMTYPQIDGLQVGTRKLLIPDRPYCEYDTWEDDTFGTIERGQVYFDVYRNVKLMEGDPRRDNQLNITVIRLGDQIAIATNPGEIFVEIGMAIRANSPYSYTFIFELTNGYEGYIPTRQAFIEGGYEVRKLNGNSHLAQDADKRLIRATVEMLNES